MKGENDVKWHFVMDACFPPSPWHSGQSEHSVVIFHKA